MGIPEPPALLPPPHTTDKAPAKPQAPPPQSHSRPVAPQDVEMQLQAREGAGAPKSMHGKVAPVGERWDEFYWAND